MHPWGTQEEQQLQGAKDAAADDDDWVNVTDEFESEPQPELAAQ